MSSREKLELVETFQECRATLVSNYEGNAPVENRGGGSTLLPRTAYPKIRKREWCRVPRVVNRCCCIAAPSSACLPTGKHTRQWHVLPGQDVPRLAPKNSRLLGRHRRLWGASASGCTRTALHPFTISGCASYIFVQDVP